MKPEKPNRISQLFRERTEAQRKLRQVLEKYQDACQALQNEIDRNEGKSLQRVSVSVVVQFGLDTKPNGSR